MFNSRCIKRVRTQKRLHRGVTSIEYALLASLIAVAIVAGVTAAGSANTAHWSNWVGQVVAALGG